MKLPAFQFYPGDWRKDPGVQSLSYHDRGVWHEMLCLMHESEQRGKLTLNGSPMTDEQLARILGLDKQNLTTTITTLLTSGVASRCEVSGALCSRRMIRDENIRKIRAEAGKLGGNPNLLKQNPTTGLKQNPTPSSSSSFSSSFTCNEQTLGLEVKEEPGKPARDGSCNSESRRRARNPLLDALVVLDGTLLEQATGPAFSKAAKALKEIREVCPCVTDEQIRAAAKRYREKWPSVTCSATAIAKHWGALQEGQRKDFNAGITILNAK